MTDETFGQIQEDFTRAKIALYQALRRRTLELAHLDPDLRGAQALEDCADLESDYHAKLMAYERACVSRDEEFREVAMAAKRSHEASARYHDAWAKTEEAQRELEGSS